MPAPGTPAVRSMSLLVRQQGTSYDQLAPDRPHEEGGVDGPQHEERRQTGDRLARLAATAGGQYDRDKDGGRVNDVAEERPELSEGNRQHRKDQEESHRSDSGVPQRHANRAAKKRYVQDTAPVQLHVLDES